MIIFTILLVWCIVCLLSVLIGVGFGMYFRWRDCKKIEKRYNNDDTNDIKP